MAYIERNARFYVVAYDGIDPVTGRERRRWHPAGRSREDAEAIATTLATEALPPPELSTSPLTFGKFLSEQWMPRRRSQLRASTAHRYQWMIDNYINPSIGDIPIRALRVEHVDHLYRELLEHASLLVAAGTPIKVVSERLGHTHPGFTMATYQHLVPGMSATAATDFANMIANHHREPSDSAPATA